MSTNVANLVLNVFLSGPNKVQQQDVIPGGVWCYNLMVVNPALHILSFADIWWLGGSLNLLADALTDFLDLDDFAVIKRAWLYEDLKSLWLTSSGWLAQKAGCWIDKPEPINSNPTGGSLFVAENCFIII